MELQVEPRVSEFVSGQHKRPGDATIQPGDVPASKDFVRCGPGIDTVYADEADVVSGDCERVRVR